MRERVREMQTSWTALNGTINEVTFYSRWLFTQGLIQLFSYHLGLVRMGSDQFYRIISLLEPRTGPKVRFIPWRELWTGLQSGLNFGSEPNCGITTRIATLHSQNLALRHSSFASVRIHLGSIQI